MNQTRDFSNSRYGPLPLGNSVLILPYGRRSFLPRLVERFGGVEIPLGENTDRIAFTLCRGSNDVTLLFSGFGAPAAANALEFAAANGARRVVLFGACGGVSPDVGVGDFVVPVGAVRGEGASRYYKPADFPAVPDPQLMHRILAASSESRDTKIHQGIVYTTDASYRQGPEVYENHVNQVIAADCECSAVFVVGATLGLRVAALFFCTDNVTLKDESDRKRSGLENDKVRRSFELGADIAVSVLAS